MMLNLKKGADVAGAGSVRRGRRRPDPLAGIWEGEIEPQLTATPEIRTVELFEELMRRHPELGPGVRRTLERRVQTWRARSGPDREVMFRQVQVPGDLGLSDFTDMSGLGVTIGGRPLAHLLYHFRLAYSGFEHARVVLGGESYTALAEGLQDALWLLGGVPRRHRTDSLSAAFRNLGLQARIDLTRRYRTLCADLGMEPSRNNRGRSHENGSIESSHGHLKRAIRDALLLRGSRDFAVLEDYRSFIGEVVSRLNSRRMKRIEAERAELGPLPERRSVDYQEATVRVTQSSGFTLKRVFYTVPSRLIGHLLKIALYDDRLEVFVGGAWLLTLPRGWSGPGGRRGRVIDYRHVIHSLRVKPMAFLRLVYRDETFPCDAYRGMFELALERLGERKACRLIVELLFLAHEGCCERQLAAVLADCLGRGEVPDLASLQSRFRPTTGELPKVAVKLPPLSSYDGLIGSDGPAAESTDALEDGS